MTKPKLQEWETPEQLALIEGWARDGLTLEDIAHNIGISRSTLHSWMKKSEDVLAALKKGREVADRIVENALFKSACGYEYTEVTREMDETGTMRVTKEVTKEVKPNPTSQIYWLKNRKPAVWRDHPELKADPNNNEILQSLAALLKKEAEG